MIATENQISTVIGPVKPKNLGMTLPHEHLFTDLRGPLVPDYAQAEPEEVVRVMLPYLKKAHDVGVRALVECSTVGVGRNVEILMQLAEATPIHLVAPTGVYREGFIPKELLQITPSALADIWVRELIEGIEGTRVKAGFIKIAVSDDGPTELEERNLKAAAIAGRETGAVVASHTIGGLTVQREMEILETSGLNLERFIWIHANLEPDLSLHLEAATRGAIIEYDGVGATWQDQEAMADATMKLIEAGFTDQLLLSHDAGWYQPGRPGGQPEEGIRGFTQLIYDFLPRLRERGLGDEEIQTITVANPARIFAFGQE